MELRSWITAALMSHATTRFNKKNNTSTIVATKLHSKFITQPCIIESLIPRAEDCAEALFMNEKKHWVDILWKPPDGNAHTGTPAMNTCWISLVIRCLCESLNGITDTSGEYPMQSIYNYLKMSAWLICRTSRSSM